MTNTMNNYTNILPKGTNYFSLYQLNEPTQNIWFLAWILKKRGCDPYLNHIILRSPFIVKRLYFTNGQLSVLITLKNGFKHGPVKSCYLNGQISEEINFVNGEKIGFRRYFYENGQLIFSAYFRRRDVVHGLLREWYKNGVLSREKKFDNGKQYGLERTWSVNGQLCYEAHYKNNFRHGLEKSWTEDGILIEENMYNNGFIISKTVVKNGKVYIKKFE